MNKRNLQTHSQLFLPTSPQDLQQLGWHHLDIILVSGDTYIDSSFIGVAVIGRVLLARGYKVGIIAQPNLDNDQDISRLGAPKLFWGVTGGSVDSMVANYTATKKKRKSDDFTPGGKNNKRPDRAVIAYTNLIKRYHKSHHPIVLGGIEASLRRLSHYDFWSNGIRGSILFDSKADYLIYGMGESAVLALADSLSGKSKQLPTDIAGLCYKGSKPKPEFVELPSLAAVKKSKQTFETMFHRFYQNNDPVSAKGLCQQHGNKYLIQNPPAKHLSPAELDEIYEYPYQNELHPYYRKDGPVRALDTIRFSITSHRGCYGECHFCAIAVHQGRTVLSRSQESILNEITRRTKQPNFRGIISDIGGPTANMYGFECPKKIKQGSCSSKRCIGAKICPKLPVSHKNQITLLHKAKQIPGIKKIFISSGIRYDLILADQAEGKIYLKTIVANHISGQMKVAPEHSEKKILNLMGKPEVGLLTTFKDLFQKECLKAGKNQFLTYYFIAAYPGCREKDMVTLKRFCSTTLKTTPEQIQIFTPTPSTYATLMYATQKDPFSARPLFVERDIKRKERQKEIIIKKRKY